MILGSGDESSLEEKLIAMVGPPSEEKLRGGLSFFGELFLKEEIFMMDFVFVGLTIFFGLISWAFIVLCSKV